MNDLEKRVLKVSEMIAANLMEAMLDFRHNTTQSNSLWDALEILAPSLKELDAAQLRVITKHELSDSLFTAARMTESTTCYAIGIIAGMHLAGRVDLIPKFASRYAATTSEGNTYRYDEDGESIALTTH